jgi:hypothetical protein
MHTVFGSLQLLSQSEEAGLTMIKQTDTYLVGLGVVS